MEIVFIDWLIIAAFAAVTIGVGLWYSKRASTSTDEFFVSGRALPWWIAGTSMVATSFAADTPLAVTGLVCKYGVAGNWFWWAFAFGGMFTAFVYARLWRRAGVVTDVELLKLRYSGKPAHWLRITRAVYITLIVIPIVVGWVTKAMLTVLKETIFYDSSADTLNAMAMTADASAVAASNSDSLAWLCVLSMLAAVALYSVLSGMWGVAITDAVQFVVAIVGCTIFAFVAVQAVGGVDELRSNIETQFGDGQAFAFFPSFSSEHPWLPLHIFVFMLGMQWWATWYPGAEPGGGGYVVQRMAACRDQRHSVLATLWFQFAHYGLRPWPWIMVAFAALALHPELRTNYLADNDFDPGVGYPMLMRELCPPGLAGLMLVTFFAAFMSTISTQMNWGASYLVCDFLVPLFPSLAHDQRKLLRASQVISVLVLLAGVAVSWLMVERNVSVDDAWKILAALGAGTGLVYMLRWFWWRINAWSEIAAMFGSLFWFLILQQPAVQTSLFGRALVTEEQTFFVASLTIVTWIVITYLTPPETDATLVSFYRQVFPSRRGWSRIAALVPDVQPDRDLGLRVFAAALGSVTIFVALPAMGAWIFGDILRATGLTIVACIFGGIMLQLLRVIAPSHSKE
ncbi:MAG: sodium:solute symporter family protein [Pirellulaceae bacterium]